jgi:hypothetical protein
MRLFLILVLLLLNYGAVNADFDGGERRNSMRVEFTTEGGIAFFPGLSKPVTIDTEQLPEIEARELKELVDTAHFFDRPTQAGTLAHGAADFRKYTITVEEGGRRHTVRLTDPVEDGDLQNLIKFLTNKAKEQRAQERKNPFY